MTDVYDFSKCSFPSRWLQMLIQWVSCKRCTNAFCDSELERNQWRKCCSFVQTRSRMMDNLKRAGYSPTGKSRWMWLNILRIIRVQITVKVAFGLGHSAGVDQRERVPRLGEQPVERSRQADGWFPEVTKAQISDDLYGNHLGFLLKMKLSGVSSLRVWILPTLSRWFPNMKNFNHWFVKINIRMRGKEVSCCSCPSAKRLSSKPEAFCVIKNAKEGLRRANKGRNCLLSQATPEPLKNTEEEWNTPTAHVPPRSVSPALRGMSQDQGPWPVSVQAAGQRLYTRSSSHFAWGRFYKAKHIVHICWSKNRNSKAVIGCWLAIQTLGLLVYLLLSGDTAGRNTPIHWFFKTNLQDRCY